MHSADYQGGGIVNLMASVAAACGGQPGIYQRLPAALEHIFSAARHIVLLVVDGLGHDFLVNRGAGSSLHEHLRARLTSVFPSTTASAVTCLLTGLPAQQHGLTGWHIYFKELGGIASILPFEPRHGGSAYSKAGIAAADLLAGTPIFDRLAVASHAVAPANLIASDFNTFYTGRARRWPYTSLESCFGAIADSIAAQGGRSFTHAYYPVLDATAHAFGCRSRELDARFARLDLAFAAFLKKIAGSDTAVIVCADHGFIDSPPERLIELEQHPELGGMLTLPLCGERRVAYCYLRPGTEQEFVDYVATEFSGRALCVPSAELLAQSWFGLGTAHPRLSDRIGDYVLLMQENWTIKDWVLGEQRHAMIGVHGGTSAAEMYVPLIVALA